MSNEQRYQPLNLADNNEILRRIKEFEAELSADAGQNISIVAYSNELNPEGQGHS